MTTRSRTTSGVLSTALGLLVALQTAAAAGTVDTGPVVRNSSTRFQVKES